MTTLLKTWFSIAFLMMKPYDLPGDQQTLRLSVLVGIISYTLAMMTVAELPLSLLRALIDVGIGGVILYTALKLLGRSERFNQSFGAYCGASAVLNLASIVLLSHASGVPAAEASRLEIATEFFYLVWGISLSAHIIRFTFDTNISISIVASVGYLLLSVSVVQNLLPV